ncbi:MAG: hypothetical protein PWP62_2387 [Eubacteriaceae bacterium]|nr:hypothetical protein [Eubacteriaceae bacterium]MDK2961219.1 hypothetical protein [Eubacteriaceae bacterium]
MFHLFNQTDTKHNEAFNDLPSSVQSMIHDVLLVMDQAYGKSRDPFRDLGGYVVVLTSINDVKAFRQFNSCLEDGTFEYVDQVDNYLGCLYLAGADYHIFLVLPTLFAPPNVISQIDAGVG